MDQSQINKNSRQFQLIKDAYIQLKEELGKEIEENNFNNNSFSIFFAGYFAGKRNNLEIVPKLLETLKLISDELEDQEDQNDMFTQNQQQLQDENSRNSQKSNSLRGMFSSIVQSDKKDQNKFKQHDFFQRQKQTAKQNLEKNKKLYEGNQYSITLNKNSNNNISTLSEEDVSNSNQNKGKGDSLPFIANCTPPTNKKNKKNQQQQQQDSSLEDNYSMELKMNQRNNRFNKFTRSTERFEEKNIINNVIGKQNKNLLDEKFDFQDSDLDDSKSYNSSRQKFNRKISASHSHTSQQQGQQQGLSQISTFKKGKLISISRGNSNSRSRSRSQSPKMGNFQRKRPSPSPEIDGNNSLRQRALMRKKQLEEKLRNIETDQVNLEKNIALLKSPVNEEDLSDEDIENNIISQQKLYKMSFNSNLNSQNHSHSQQLSNQRRSRIQSTQELEDEDEQEEIIPSQKITFQKKQGRKIDEKYMKTLQISQNQEEDEELEYEQNYQMEEEEEEEEQEEEKIQNNGNGRDDEYELKREESFEKALKLIQQQEDEEKLNQQLIKQLQDEDSRNMQQYKEKLQEKENEDNQCNICFDDLMNDDVVPLQECPHIFHKECFLGYIKNLIDNRKVEFKCPEEGCEKMVVVGDFRDIIEKKYYDKYLGYSISNFVDDNAAEATWCPTADCNYVFLLEEQQDKNQFKCPICKKEYCLNCKVDYNKGHKGMTCKEFQVSNKRDENDVKFEKFVKGHKYKQCPHCSYWVSRTTGCFNMVCKCGHSFCYTCGGPTVNHHCPACQGKGLKRQQQRAPAFPGRAVQNKPNKRGRPKKK